MPAPTASRALRTTWPPWRPSRAATPNTWWKAAGKGSTRSDLKITGTLYGLPSGPVPVEGRAMGVVEVRNPTFALSFNHPATVSAGEEYDLLVSVTNISTAPANYVSVGLLPRSISGAQLLSDPVQQVDMILPGDSAMLTFRLLALRTGTVVANSFASDGIPGKFELRTAVGELGIPMSPTSLVLPKAAYHLPTDLFAAGVALLNQALALATSPTTPEGLLPFGSTVVFEHAVDLAGAGQRVGLHEPAPAAARDLALDFLGNNRTRLAERYRPDQVATLERDYAGFDLLLRQSRRGAALAKAIGAVWGATLPDQGALAFQQDFAEAVASRPAHLSAIVGSPTGPAPVVLSLTDPAGHSLGQLLPDGPIRREIPYGGFFDLLADGPSHSQFALLGVPAPGEYMVDVVGAAAGTFDLGLVFPTAAGLRHITFAGVAVAAGSRGRVLFTAGGSPGATDPALQLDLDGDGLVDRTIPPTRAEPVLDRVPRPISAVQVFTGQKDGTKYGQVVGVLFAEEVISASVQDGVTAPGRGDRLRCGRQRGRAPAACSRITGSCSWPCATALGRTSRGP